MVRKQLLPIATLKVVECQSLFNLLDNLAPTNLSIYRAVQEGNADAYFSMLKRQMLQALSMDRRNYKFALADIVSQIGWYWPSALPELNKIFQAHCGLFDEYMIEHLHSLVAILK